VPSSSKSLVNYFVVVPKELDLRERCIAVAGYYERTHFLRRSLILMSAFALAGFGVFGCGSTATPRTVTSRTQRTVEISTTASSKSASGGVSKNDVDHDSDANDDDYLYGHAASSADMRTIAMLLKSYYEAAAADDGKRACSMLYSLLAEEIPELYGEQPGSPALSGKTCAVVMSKFFRQYTRQLLSDAATIKVTTVRVRRNRALAIMSFRSMPRRDILVHREHQSWKVDELMDTELA
jgi:hypothetical protein